MLIIKHGIQSYCTRMSSYLGQQIKVCFQVTITGRFEMPYVYIDRGHVSNYIQQYKMRKIEYHIQTIIEF